MDDKQDWEIKCPYRYLFKKENTWYCKEPSRITDPINVGFKKCVIMRCPLRVKHLNLYYITHETVDATTTYHFTSELSFEHLPNCVTIAKILNIDYDPISNLESIWISMDELSLEIEERIKKHRVRCIDDNLYD
jgi:hypothetical protein